MGCSNSSNQNDANARPVSNSNQNNMEQSNSTSKTPFSKKEKEFINKVKGSSFKSQNGKPKIWMDKTEVLEPKNQIKVGIDVFFQIKTNNECTELNIWTSAGYQSLTKVQGNLWEGIVFLDNQLEDVISFGCYPEELEAVCQWEVSKNVDYQLPESSKRAQIERAVPKPYNIGTVIYEPTTIYLKKGQKNHFRLFIELTTRCTVWTTDGHQDLIEIEDDFWEGDVFIPNDMDDVYIFCLYNGDDDFEAVCQFKAVQNQEVVVEKALTDLKKENEAKKELKPEEVVIVPRQQQIIKPLKQAENNEFQAGKIPEEYGERFNFLCKLFRNIRITDHVKNAPKRTKSTIQKVGQYLKTISNDELEKAAVLYLWMAENIAYDVKSFLAGISPDCSAEGTFKKGKSVCSGYARCFKGISEHMDIEVANTMGYAKGYGYKKGSNCRDSNHEWNIVKIYGEWYIVDSTWGSGCVSNRAFLKRFSPFYFCPDSRLMFETHHPDEDQWQLINPPEKLSTFQDAIPAESNTFFNMLWTNGIRLFDYCSPEIKTEESNLAIKVGFKEKLQFIWNLKKDGKEVSTCYEANDLGDNVYEFDVKIPGNGKYEMMIFIHPDNGKGGSYDWALTYKINAI